MTDVCARGRAGFGLLHWLAAGLFLAAVAAPALAAEPVVVRLDQATLFNLPPRAATVVIGNPLIADVSILPDGNVVITGKGYGATNVIVLDRAGAVLAEHSIEVKGPSDPIVVVYRGVNQETYSCTPICQPRITLGDYKDYFLETLAESTTRDAQAEKPDSANSGQAISLSGGGATAGAPEHSENAK